MKSLRIAHDIVPIAEFKAQAAQYLKHIDDTGDAVIITQNGKPAGVLLSPAEYDRLADRQRVLEKIARGLAAADAGDAVGPGQARRILADRRRKK